ncbi:MAG: DUF2059 domain-containing protein [Candidatus Omnitrophica bacterium]|nr:DUF2059 domain-containing protein [Candidatus Omnitrophota bacterium]
MKYTILTIPLILFLVCPKAHGEVITFKDGRVVKQKILSQDNLFVTIEVNGYPRRYYRDLIESIAPDESQMEGVSAGKGNVLGFEASDFNYISQEKIDLIVKFLVSSGIKDTMEQNIEKVLVQVPKEQRGQFKQIFNVNEALKKVVTVYDTYFFEDELRQLNAFYESPVGKKFHETRPKIIQDAMKEMMDFMQEKMSASQMINP